MLRNTCAAWVKMFYLEEVYNVNGTLSYSFGFCADDSVSGSVSVQSE